jgi:hypothetical protein
VVEIFDDGVEVEGLEFFGIVEIFAEGVAFGGMLMEEAEVKLLRPPILVAMDSGGSGDGAVEFTAVVRAFSFVWVCFVRHHLSCSRFASTSWISIGAVDRYGKSIVSTVVIEGRYD